MAGFYEGCTPKRYSTSSDDSDHFENFLSSLKKKKNEKYRLSSGSLDEFIADDNFELSYQGSFSEASDKIGSRESLDAAFNNLALDPISPFKDITLNQNIKFGDKNKIKVTVTPKKQRTKFQEGQECQNIEKNTKDKENANMVQSGTIRNKPKVFSTRIVFSSSESDVEVIPVQTPSQPKSSIYFSDSDSDIEFIGHETFKPKLPVCAQTISTAKTVDIQSTSSDVFDDKENSSNDNLDSYKSLIDRIKKPTILNKRRGNSLGESNFKTPTSQVKTKSHFQTEKMVHVASRLKPKDGLPSNLPPKCSLGKQFKLQRKEITGILYKYFNETVFENKLDPQMEVEWSNRLLKTAGITKCRKRTLTKMLGGKKISDISYSSSIQLSEKVIDNLQRLRDTLIHEMCHAAVWVISKVNESHGPYWKWWAQKAMKQFPEMAIIKRCHSYDITYKYYYKCNTCRQSIGRHSKSIDTDKKVCGICKGKLVLQLNSNGTTPSKPRTPNKFALFVKENYDTKKQSDKNLKHGDVMKLLSKDFAKVNLP